MFEIAKWIGGIVIGVLLSGSLAYFLDLNLFGRQVYSIEYVDSLRQDSSNLGTCSNDRVLLQARIETCEPDLEICEGELATQTEEHARASQGYALAAEQLQTANESLSNARQQSASLQEQLVGCNAQLQRASEVLEAFDGVEGTLVRMQAMAQRHLSGTTDGDSGLERDLLVRFDTILAIRMAVAELETHFNSSIDRLGEDIRSGDVDARQMYDRISSIVTELGTRREQLMNDLFRLQALTAEIVSLNEMHSE